MCIRDRSKQRISIPTITTFYSRLKWFVGPATAKLPQLLRIRRCYTRKRIEQSEICRHFNNPSPLVYRYIQAKNFYSNDYWFLSPPEVVRPLHGQICAIANDSTLLYSEKNRASRNMSTFSQSITSRLQIQAKNLYSNYYYFL